MSTFVANDEQKLAGLIYAGFFDSFLASTFTDRFPNLHELGDAVIIEALNDAVLKVGIELEYWTATYDNNITIFGIEKGRDAVQKIFRLHRRAVHYLALADILSGNISISDTKAAEYRNENLQERVQQAMIASREAIAMIADEPTIGVAIL